MVNKPIQPPAVQSTEPPIAENYPLPAKKWSIRFSLRVKLIAMFLLVAIIPLGLFVYLNYLTIQQMLYTVANRALMLEAAKTAADINDFINSNKTVVGEVAAWPEIVDYSKQASQNVIKSEDEGQIRQLLERLKGQNKWGADASYWLLDEQGRNLLDKSLNLSQAEASQEYFTVPLQGFPYYISPLLFDSADTSVLYFSAPIRHSVGKIGGVLLIRYEADVLQKIIEQHNNQAGESSFGILMDTNHIRLAYGVNPELRYKTLVPLPAAEIARLKTARLLPNRPDNELSTNNLAFEEGVTGSQNNFVAPLDDADQKMALGTVTKIEGQPWAVVFVQPQQAAVAQLREQFFSIGVIVAVIIIIILVAAFNITRYVVTPIVRLATVAQHIASGALGLQVPVDTHDEIGLLAKSFNSLTLQMSELSSNVEKVITERTRAMGNIVRALETSTQIGRQLTTILDVNDLLRYVVNRIQVEFSFYYTQIYLVEAQTGDLIMTEGSGGVGQKLKEQGHRLKAGQGIVGTVASSNEFFMSNDVSKVLNFVSNPLLPKTQSELALPLRKGNRVMGVLDIQSDQLNRFVSADVSLLQSIANQTAVAIDNARLLAETQAALSQIQRLNQRLTREGWDQFGADITTSAYRFSRGRSVPIDSASLAWLSPMKRAALEKQLVKHAPPNGDKATTELAVPLVLRGEVIGMLGLKREDTQDWADEEIAAVEAVANQVTLALENARLSKEQERTIVELKEVDRLQREFLTSMSHELRTPLNSIIGFADVILQGIDGEVSDLALNDVQLIYNSGQHLLTLINDILDLAKIEAGKMELFRETLDIEELVDEVLSSVISLRKSRLIEIVTDIQPDLPSIYADKLRFKQILLNLVSNAVKFTEKGTITVKATTVAQDPSLALISVIDQGVGIPAHLLEAVFDRFRQVENVATRKTGGTGLGLPICKQLVELHGGTITVTSEVGQGSNFNFTIPFVQLFTPEDESIIAHAIA